MRGGAAGSSRVSRCERRRQGILWPHSAISPTVDKMNPLVVSFIHIVSSRIEYTRRKTAPFIILYKDASHDPRKKHAILSHPCPAIELDASTKRFTSSAHHGRSYFVVSLGSLTYAPLITFVFFHVTSQSFRETHASGKPKKNLFYFLFQTPSKGGAGEIGVFRPTTHEATDATRRARNERRNRRRPPQPLSVSAIIVSAVSPLTTTSILSSPLRLFSTAFFLFFFFWLFPAPEKKKKKNRTLRFIQRT